MEETQHHTNTVQLHQGHRKRMKNSLISGNHRFEDHQLLEMLLFYSIPRRDTNELAHKLIRECGSLKEVLYAPPEKITAIDGIGIETATQLVLLREIYRRVRKNKYGTREEFDTLTKVGELALSYFDGDKNERVSAMLFDNKMHLLDIVELSRGGANSAPFDKRELARVALLHNATRVILAHNHPSGDTLPSTHDRMANQGAESALEAVGITLIEHLIVSDVGYTPMMQMRMSFYLKMGKNDPKAQFFNYFYAN